VLGFEEGIAVGTLVVGELLGFSVGLDVGEWLGCEVGSNMGIVVGGVLGC
jgi:hypothetical protein